MKHKTKELGDEPLAGGRFASYKLTITLWSTLSEEKPLEAITHTHLEWNTRASHRPIIAPVLWAGAQPCATHATLRGKSARGARARTLQVCAGVSVGKVAVAFVHDPTVLTLAELTISQSRRNGSTCQSLCAQCVRACMCIFT